MMYMITAFSPSKKKFRALFCELYRIESKFKNIQKKLKKELLPDTESIMKK